MVLPFDRNRLRERNRLDEADELAAAAAQTPAARVEEALALSDFARTLGEAAKSDWLAGSPDELPEKSRLYARPLQLLVKQ